MKTLSYLFENNQKWAAKTTAREPDFFRELTQQQAPEYLWIGCSDSRVPANEIVGLRPGELFVHRNVGNLVVHSDMNCLSVIHYAVEILKIRHIMVCGHYGCGGIKAAMDPRPHGLIDNWLRHIQDIQRKRQTELDSLPSDAARLDRLCELNVLEQVANVGRTTVVREAWAKGVPLQLHGWIYDIHDGLLRDLNVTTTSEDDMRALEAR